MPKPCPFCGIELRPLLNGAKTEPVAYTHPLDGAGLCYMSGVSVGVSRLSLWDARVRPVQLAYGVEQSRPVFNDVGQGRPATADVLNEFVAYYEESILRVRKEKG